jgi:competence protein ComEA
MNRTGWLAVVALGALGAGAAVRWAWPSSAPALDCPVEDVRWVWRGGTQVAACAPPEDAGAAPTGAALTVGVKLDLNRATEEQLAMIPGVGRSLAGKLVEARRERGPFRSWQEVDEVPGVGPVKLAALQALAEISPE